MSAVYDRPELEFARNSVLFQEMPCSPKDGSQKLIPHSLQKYHVVN